MTLHFKEETSWLEIFPRRSCGCKKQAAPAHRLRVVVGARNRRRQLWQRPLAPLGIFFSSCPPFTIIFDFGGRLSTTIPSPLVWEGREARVGDLLRFVLVFGLQRIFVRFAVCGIILSYIGDPLCLLIVVILRGV